MPKTKPATKFTSIRRAATGIYGLDDITQGGLPQGRPTLLCGSAGTGKTMFAMEFLYHGAADYNEPGVFMSFEENEPELIKNFSSLGYNLNKLASDGKLTMDYVSIERSEIEETGEYDLEGLFVRLGYAIDSIGAKRVVLDTLEALFGGLKNEGILRAELRRLFRWLKDKGVTAIITAERGKEGGLTRYGIEEYVSDCVILLDNRVVNELVTRRLRILKYRGSAHGTNEYPFTIDEQGITIMPVSAMRLEHPAPIKKVSSGLKQLDDMLGGGVYRGSSVLISGMAGTGKSTMAASFVNAGCARGERCLYFASEESPQQIMRNMRSIGLDLEKWAKNGVLLFQATRPSMQGLETHLLRMERQITAFKPSLVVVDALTDFEDLGTPLEVKWMATRIVDFLKSQEITGMFTGLVSTSDVESSGVGVSSTMDTWMHVSNVQNNLERNRVLYLIKSRGVAHSNQVREFLITNRGIKLADIYMGPGGALLGSARLAQEGVENMAVAEREMGIKRKRSEIARKRSLLDAQIGALRAAFDSEAAEIEGSIQKEKSMQKLIASGEQKVLKKRESAIDLSG